MNMMTVNPTKTIPPIKFGGNTSRALTPEEVQEYEEDELEFLSVKRELDDFKVGLKVPGKLMPKRIRGGVLLVDTNYEMR